LYSLWRNSSQSRWLMPEVKRLGSKAGTEASAITSPECTSITTVAPLWPCMRLVAKSWISMSMVRERSPPGVPSWRSISRTTRPTALTSTRLRPARPRKPRSCSFSTPPLPMRNPGSSSSGSPVSSASATALT
jgi:hypothetical protein